MKRAFLTYFIIFIIILAVLCAVSPQIQEICIFLSYNALFFIDNSFSFSKAINPLFAWTIVFALLGLIIGLAKTVTVFKLHKKFYLYSFLGIILLLFLINTCSQPLKYNSSREIREEMLWRNLNKKNSYSICTFYINEFPEGKHISEIKSLQEGALWDSASVSKSSKVWKLYCDKFKNGTRYLQASNIYDKIRWSELSKINTTESYRKYLSEFPNGIYSKSAQKKIDKNLLNNKPAIKPEENQSEIQSQSDTIVTGSSAQGTEIKHDSVSNKSSTSNNYYGELDLPGGIKYKGYIVNNLPNGHGEEVFLDKTSYKGFYINGKREGEFIFTKTDGSEEKRFFNNGNRIEKSPQSYQAKPTQTSNYVDPSENKIGMSSGEGKEIFPDGTTLSGNYVDGKRNGDFIYTRKDGTKEKQVFKNGVRIK